MLTLKPQDHAKLIVIRGIPGSGKSYLATALYKALGEGEAVMLDPDATDYTSETYRAHTEALTAEGVDPKLHAYRFLRAQAYQAIADRKIIVWNQPFTNLEIFNQMVQKLHEKATEEHTMLSVLVVEVALDPEVAKARVIARKQAGGHGPSDATLQQRIDDYTTFSDQGFATVSVHGDDPVDASIATVDQVLQAM